MPMAMTHANRSRRIDAPARNPRWNEVRDARARAGLTQHEAAHAVFATESAWARWEANPETAQDTRFMPAASWWLFRLRTRQAELSELSELTRGGRAAGNYAASPTMTVPE